MTGRKPSPWIASCLAEYLDHDLAHSCSKQVHGTAFPSPSITWDDLGVVRTGANQWGKAFLLLYLTDSQGCRGLLRVTVTELERFLVNHSSAKTMMHSFMQRGCFTWGFLENFWDGFLRPLIDFICRAVFYQAPY